MKFPSIKIYFYYISLIFIFYFAIIFLLDFVLENSRFVFLAKIFIYLSIVIFFSIKVLLPIKRIEDAVNSFIHNDNILTNLEYKEKNLKLNNIINNVLNKVKGALDREYMGKFLKKQAEINALQSQINPHFLYNTLDSIRSQALFEGSKEIASMIETLSALFRYSISKGGNLATFEEELKNINDYLTIQQYRFNNRFRIEKKIDEKDLILMNAKLPKLTLQPVVENAIFHGLERKMGKGKLALKAFATEKRLIIIISDNGIGMKTEELKMVSDRLQDSLVIFDDNKTSTSGIALLNVNQRIRLYFGEKYGINMFSTYGIGTKVEIVLPLIHDMKTIERNIDND